MEPVDNNNAIIGNVECYHPLIFCQIFTSNNAQQNDRTTAEE